jgi:hypothetical protein
MGALRKVLVGMGLSLTGAILIEVIPNGVAVNDLGP